MVESDAGATHGGSREPEQGPRPTIRLRGHTLLCLQGFRGLGYSPGFVENLAGIHQQLALHLDTLVEVVEEPDAVCGACPHRAAGGCSLNGADSEEDMRAQDHDVLSRLGLGSGDRATWRDILERIRRAVSPDALPDICGTCRWLSLGYCREGLARLRAQDADPLIPADALRPTRAPSS